LYFIVIHLGEPLRNAPPNPKLQLLSICAQLDTLQQKSTRSTEWSDIVYEAQTNLSNISHLQSIDQLPSPLLTIFPHITKTNLQGKDMFDEYISQIALLNQLSNIAAQLRHDIVRYRNHKYIAHQIALLYQTLGQLGGTIGERKKEIEERFDEIKATTELSKEPALTEEQTKWLVNLTTSVIQEISQTTHSLPKLQPLVQFVNSK